MQRPFFSLTQKSHWATVLSLTPASTWTPASTSTTKLMLMILGKVTFNNSNNSNNSNFPSQLLKEFPVIISTDLLYVNCDFIFGIILD